MNILYICNGNVGRSQEAELFTNALAKGKHSAVSAGVNPTIGKPIDPIVVEAMREVGYRMDGSVRKPIDEGMIRNADIVVSFKPARELPEFVRHHPRVQYWNVDDPQGQPLEFHRKTRDAVKARVEALLAEL